MPSSRTPKDQASLDFGVLSSFLGFRLRVAQLLVYADFMRNAPVRGLTPGQVAILVLIDQNRDVTQQRLCDSMHIEKSTLVVRLHRLAERGLVQRVRSTQDRRQNTLKLTKKGSDTLKTMLAFVNRHERKIAERLTAAERKELLSLLSRVG